MKRLWLSLSLVVLGAFASAAFKPGYVEVHFWPRDEALARLIIPARMGAKVVSERKEIGWLTLALPGGMSVVKAVNYLARQKQVENVEPLYYRRPLFVPNDPSFGRQYGPQIIGAETAWNFTLGSSRVTIGMIDTGIDLKHPEFAGRIEVLPGCNLADGNSDASDADGHGTHTSGIAAAATDNATGIAGICGNATIMPVKVFSGANGGTIDVVSQGYIFAANHGADVINASLGGTDFSQEEEQAVLYCEGKGVLFCASAGNDGLDELEYPAAYIGVIACGASDASDAQTSYTNYGDWVTVAAPGDAIYSTWIGESYQNDSGTSMSAPHVAGALALLKSYAPIGTDPSVIRNLLLSTTDPVGTWVHYGRIDVGSAMTLLNQAEGGAATAYPTAVTRYEGATIKGDVTSLFSLDGATYQIKSNSPYQFVQAASAQIEFLLPALPTKIKSAKLTYAGFGHDNGVQFLYVYDYLKKVWKYIGQSSMTATGDTAHQLSLPMPIGRYARNGVLKLVVRGYLSASSNGGSDPAFTYQIDQATLALKVSGI